MLQLNKLNRVTLKESYLLNGSINLICDLEYDKEHEFLCGALANDSHYIIFLNANEFEATMSNFKNNRIWFKDASNDTIGITRFLNNFKIYDYQPYLDYLQVKSAINGEVRAKYRGMNYLYSFFDNNIMINEKHIYSTQEQLKAIKTLDYDIRIMSSYVFNFVLKHYTSNFDVMISRIIVEKNMIIDDRSGKFQFWQFKTDFTSKFTEYVAKTYKSNVVFRSSISENKIYTKLSLKFTILPEIYTRHLRFGRAFLSELAFKDDKYIHWQNPDPINIEALVGEDIQIDNIKVENLNDEQNDEKNDNKIQPCYALFGGKKYEIEFDDVELPILPLLKPADALISINNKYVSEFESRNGERCVFPIHFSEIFISNHITVIKVNIMPGMRLI